LSVTVVFFPDTAVSSTNKTNRYNIAEILFNMTLNTRTLTPKLHLFCMSPKRSTAAFFIFYGTVMSKRDCWCNRHIFHSTLSRVPLYCNTFPRYLNRLNKYISITNFKWWRRLMTFNFKWWRRLMTVNFKWWRRLMTFSFKWWRRLMTFSFKWWRRLMTFSLMLNKFKYQTFLVFVPWNF
jgi:hypothetical protein